mmetsp:Transcript_18788/g.63988  ORF Transcript_18788/g.63988 Transcript_18788/m.63988 type:complete len:391 (+) Transcript_18788:2102-3274(+)
MDSVDCPVESCTWDELYSTYLKYASKLSEVQEVERTQLLLEMWQLRVRMETLGKDPSGVQKRVSSEHSAIHDRACIPQKSCADPYIAVRGGKLYAKVFSDSTISNRPDLVFIHGDSSNHLSWFQQASYFKKFHRCILYDQRGFGFSEDSLCLDSSEFCNDLCTVLDTFASKKCIIIAQSQGTMTATQFAKEHKDRVIGLCLISWSPLAFHIPAVNEEILLNADTMLRKRFLQSSKNQFSEQDRKDALDSLKTTRNGLSPEFREDNLGLTFLFQMLRETNKEVRALLGRSRGNQPFSPWITNYMPNVSDLAQWRVPTTFVYGEYDKYKKCMLVAPQHIKQSKTYEIKGCGHFCFFENAQLVNEYIEMLVNDILATPRQLCTPNISPSHLTA